MDYRLPRHVAPRLLVTSAAAIALVGGVAGVAAAATPAAGHPRNAPSSPWSTTRWHPGGWWGGPGAHPMPAAGAGPTEYFHVVSTRSSGPGTIVVTGVVNAGGTEKPGRAIDQATFAGGAFRIDHSSGQPQVHFDASTCVGTINQSGPFRVIDATGTMANLAGSGHYVFRALYTTARVGTHCSSTTTAYTETIDGVESVKGR